MTSHLVLFRTMGFTRIGMSCAASGPQQRPILDVMQSTVRLRSLLKYEKQVKHCQRDNKSGFPL